ncbi:GNAT family N-acetyltransferase [Clostridium tagluense]|uniref:GNAT family N-acetyltransferase n=1 Tax=Clostridium tagluense TaxID=360422 RepID=UPI001C6EF40A|nr:GNAT family N-acetyltransferase [Clostridium tagluense]MBW9157377.1 GNAT family N-acetyltransferase [Clostridium tagluense]WLC66755.1 GNAT family N-acetyltransferase [Clostridium tagluense]
MINIIKAEVEDSKIITEIKKLAYNDETRRFGPGRDGGPPGYESQEETERLIKDYLFYKIMIGNNIIGFFWLHGEDNKFYELEDLCIHPEYHNKGYGFKTLKLIEELHPQIKKWVLGTPYYSVRNQHLYEKVGYKKTGQTEDGFLFFYEKLID